MLHCNNYKKNCAAKNISLLLCTIFKYELIQFELSFAFQTVFPADGVEVWHCGRPARLPRPVPLPTELEVQQQREPVLRGADHWCREYILVHIHNVWVNGKIFLLFFLLSVIGNNLFCCDLLRYFLQHKIIKEVGTFSMFTVISQFEMLQSSI